VFDGLGLGEWGGGEGVLPGIGVGGVSFSRRGGRGVRVSFMVLVRGEIVVVWGGYLFPGGWGVGVVELWAVWWGGWGGRGGVRVGRVLSGRICSGGGGVLSYNGGWDLLGGGGGGGGGGGFGGMGGGGGGVRGGWGGWGGGTFFNRGRSTKGEGEGVVGGGLSYQWGWGLGVTSD